MKKKNKNEWGGERKKTLSILLSHGLDVVKVASMTDRELMRYSGIGYKRVIIARSL
ncbi:MAG: hypothetical protein KGL39_39460 [Patescibacteria group bacterium]|nr:hypothetical protein [Patescibacteria group bacterium]